MILKLPVEQQLSKLSQALNVEPPQKKQLDRIATLNAGPGQALTACAVANYARWVLRGRQCA